jgi:DNA-binding NtrC family response regulator
MAEDAAAHPRQRDEEIVLDEFLADIERELLRRALATSRGNKARAAKLLGISRPRLLRRLEQLGPEA